MIVGVDIGGTKTAVMVVDQQHAVLATQTWSTRLEHLIDGVVDAIRQCLVEARVEVHQLTGIGVGVPGQIDHQTGEIAIAVNLNIFKPFPLAAALSDALRVPVWVENDVRLAAYGVYRHLDKPNLAYLNLGTGVSAGIVLDGRVHRGLHGVAGEIGYVQARLDGAIYENLISGPAITRRAVEIGLTAQHAGDVYQQAQAGDQQAIALIDQVSLEIALVVQLLLYAVDVELVVLGGGVTAGRTLFLNPIRRQLARLRETNPLNARLLTNERVALLDPGFNPGLWGSIYLAQARKND